MAHIKVHSNKMHFTLTDYHTEQMFNKRGR